MCPATARASVEYDMAIHLITTCSSSKAAAPGSRVFPYHNTDLSAAMATWRVLVVDESMPVCQQWKAKTIIAVQAERIENGKGYDFVRFYISSRALDATSALKATRAHWSVENLLHWTLDIAFGEDQLQARAGFAGENLAVIRQWILNILKQNKSRNLSMANKRRLCCLNEQYLFECMGLFKV